MKVQNTKIVRTKLSYVDSSINAETNRIRGSERYISLPLLSYDML
jgi:hypothetical protein